MKSYRGNMGSGKSVPRSGTYGFFHAHSSAHEITLLKDRIFPFCPRCSDPVEFVLIRAVPVESALGRFRLLMHGSNISAPNHRPMSLSDANRQRQKLDQSVQGCDAGI
jgi:hypothetical protein